MSEPARRKKRRVVRLSRVDQEKLDSGEFATAEDAIHQYDAKPDDAQPADSPSEHPGSGVDATQPASTPRPNKRQRAATSELSQRDREILADRPPHFGNL